MVAVLAVVVALSAGCSNNIPDTTAVDFGDDAWESNNVHNSGRWYYLRRCEAELVASWAAGTPQWEYLDCLVDNDAPDYESPYSTSVRHWRDRQVAWDTLQTELRRVEVLESIDARLSGCADADVSLAR